jgi:hypothetical protein
MNEGKSVSFSDLVGFSIVIAIAWHSGWRDVGIDRAEYITNWNLITRSEDWLGKLFFSKDLTFLILTEITASFSDDPRYTFLIFNFLSLVTKFAAFRKLFPNQKLALIIIYGLFLSPGLEYAAIRAGLALGFLCLSLAYREKIKIYLIFSFLAIISHLSFIIPVTLGISGASRILTNYPVLYLFGALFIYFSTGYLIQYYPYGEDYIGNHGSIFAYALPLIVLSIGLFTLVDMQQGSLSTVPMQTAICFKSIILGLVALSFGVTGFIVTASTRFLEIAACLLLIIAIGKNNSPSKWMGIILWLILMSYMNLNLSRQTWQAIADPNVYVSKQNTSHR